MEEIFTRRVTVDQAEGSATGSLNILIGLTLKECTVSLCLNLFERLDCGLLCFGLAA